MARGSSQAYDLRVSREPLEPDRIAKFAHTLLRGIAAAYTANIDRRGTEESSAVGGDLTDLLFVSACMRQSGARIDDSLDAMLRLRRAILSAAPMDHRGEPVPLLVSDPKVALVSLTGYLEDLLRRASICGDVSVDVLAQRAIDNFAASGR